MSGSIKILGTKLDSITHIEAKTRFAKLFELKSKSIVTTPNTEMVINAKKDIAFAKILNEESRLNLPDGIGTLWAARYNSLYSPKTPVIREIVLTLEWLLSIITMPLFIKMFKEPLPEKISGSDFILDIANIAAENKYRIFLLGGAPTVAERTSLKLQTDIYGLRVGGVFSGRADETDKIVELVNKSKADILLVAFGAPKQEKWLSDNLKKTCAKVGVGLGGSFDFIAGVRPRAPRLIQKIGFEWLYRLAIEPSRITRQMTIPYFMWLVLVQKLSK
jgi:N-acetylglucosaminyldiphosphoundecaprenol N-acetyl-beta-D-mannosaminyltransferase